MKTYERREAGITASFKLAIWNDRNQSWKELKGSHATEAEAIIGATKPGRYRVSRVEGGSFSDVIAFTVPA